MTMAHAGCIPPSGRTYLTIGQDLDSVKAYLQEFHSAATPPVAFMFYTDLHTLKGLDAPVDYGSGIEYADGLLALQNSAALQIGLWLNGTMGCRAIVEGRLEAQMERLWKYVMDRPNRQFFLRVGYEFDNPEFGYDDPLLYKRAFRKLVLSCQQYEACRGQVDFVWHSWAAGLPAGTSYDDYYPGNDMVDWIGVSLFTQFYPTSALGNRDTVRAAADYAKHCSKPLMVAESTPFGGIPTLSDPWKEWFQPVLDFVESNDVGMWSYIACNWDAQPMWEGVGFGDTRLSVNATVEDLWKRHVLSNNRFRVASECVSGDAAANTPLWPMAFQKILTYENDQNEDAHLWNLIHLVAVVAIVLLIMSLRYACRLRREIHLCETRLDSDDIVEDCVVYGTLTRQT